MFIRAREGDSKLRAVLLRYDRLLATKREKERWKQMFRTELVGPPSHPLPLPLNTDIF